MNYKELKEGDIVGTATFDLSSGVIFTVIRCKICKELCIVPMQEGIPFKQIMHRYFSDEKDKAVCLICYSAGKYKSMESEPNPN